MSQMVPVTVVMQYLVLCVVVLVVSRSVGTTKPIPTPGLNPAVESHAARPNELLLHKNGRYNVAISTNSSGKIVQNEYRKNVFKATHAISRTRAEPDAEIRVLMKMTSLSSRMSLRRSERSADEQNLEQESSQLFQEGSQLFQVITCIINVTCNMGTPNSECTCVNDLDAFGQPKCTLPKARITHKSKVTIVPMNLFCAGVALPLVDDKTHYDVHASCSIFAPQDVSYKVNFIKEDGERDVKTGGLILKYKACLEPEMKR
ncbi:Hypp6335 [Branchiostoma lanceolatum]|uniref:Hypp6335 protein n=1 Tax=Branchiostoma lanceolatum TaxID=7740 RepID=A0A8J9YT52_BRALA|nr:Hypp6335 [Branchiostoma lanceolatum]